jgi:hypothetical protein
MKLIFLELEGPVIEYLKKMGDSNVLFKQIEKLPPILPVFFTLIL